MPGKQLGRHPEVGTKTGGRQESGPEFVFVPTVLRRWWAGFEAGLWRHFFTRQRLAA
jgi:hypothetical protein